MIWKPPVQIACLNSTSGWRRGGSPCLPAWPFQSRLCVTPHIPKGLVSTGSGPTATPCRPSSLNVCQVKPEEQLFPTTASWGFPTHTLHWIYKAIMKLRTKCKHAYDGHAKSSSSNGMQGRKEGAPRLPGFTPCPN